MSFEKNESFTDVTFSPSPNLRSDVLREKTKASHDFEDLCEMVSSAYHMYARIEQALSPYNSRQNKTNNAYEPPSINFLKEAAGRAPRNLPPEAYDGIIQAAQNFCVKNAGRKNLPLVHPITHHSIQFPHGTFKIVGADMEEWLEKRPHAAWKPMSVHKIIMQGVETPVYIENLRDNPGYHHMILRPKASKTGVPNLTIWEALFWKAKYPYLIEHVDSNSNPRHAGVLPNTGRNG